MPIYCKGQNFKDAFPTPSPIPFPKFLIPCFSNETQISVKGFCKYNENLLSVDLRYRGYSGRPEPIR